MLRTSDYSALFLPLTKLERYRKFHDDAVKDFKCPRCGLEESDAAEWHHPGKKNFGIGWAIDNPAKHTLNEILAEMNKCELICASCHRIHHKRENRARKNKAIIEKAVQELKKAA